MKKTKQTKQTAFSIIKAAIVLIIFSVILFLFKDEFKESETYNYGNTEEYNQIELTNDQPITQVFEVKHSILLDIILDIDFNETQEGTLNIQLFNSDGQKIQSFDYDLNLLTGSNSIGYPLTTKLKAGSTYSIVFKVNNSVEGKGPLLHYIVDNDSVNTLNISGNQNFGELNARYNYVYYNLKLIGLYTLIVILITSVQLMPSAFYKKIKGKIKYISMFAGLLVPAAAFFMFETITENLSTITGGVAVLYNILIFYGIYILVMAVTNSVRFTIVFLNTFLFLLAGLEYFIQLFRGRPIMPADLYSVSTALSVADQYDFKPTVTMIITLAVITLINLLAIKLPYRIKKLKIRLGYIILAVSFNFIIFNGMINEDWPARHGLVPDFWALSEGYAKNGFMLSTVIQLDYLKVEKPEEYSASTVAASAGTMQLDHFNGQSGQEAIIPDNIIVIMNESWSDLSVINDFNTSSEVSPFISSLSKNTIKGNLYVSVFGGGTANTEYEMLTGNTTAFLPPGSFPYQLYVKQGDDSLVSLMNASGYKTVSFHPQAGTNWNRNKVYECLGFDEFYTIADFNGDYVRGLPSDYSDFEQITSFYEEKEAGEKLFVFNVTMQNHGGYGYDEFENTVSLTDYPGEFPGAEQYLSLLQLTDSSFEFLVDYFSDIDENTMILMYGDHQPAVEEGFYEWLFGKSLNELTAEEMQKKHITPFVLWTNYDIEEGYVEKISANYLSTLLIEQAGLEMPFYNQFLSELSKDIPVIDLLGYYDITGLHYSWDGVSDLDNHLNKYRTLQYNNVFDKKNRLKNFFNLDISSI